MAFRDCERIIARSGNIPDRDNYFHTPAAELLDEAVNLDAPV
jgi:hypothetical protein